MDIIRADVAQIDAHDLLGFLHIEVHARGCHDVFDPFRDLEHTASSGHAEGFHRGRDRQADRSPAALGIGDHKVDFERVKSPIHALHRGVKTFQINTKISFFHGIRTLSLDFSPVSWYIMIATGERPP